MRSFFPFIILLMFFYSCKTTVTEYRSDEGDSSCFLDLDKDSVAEGSFYVNYVDKDLVVNGTINLTCDSLQSLKEFYGEADGLKQDSITYSIYSYDTKSQTDMKTTSFGTFKRSVMDTIKRGCFVIYFKRIYFQFIGPKITIRYSIKLGSMIKNFTITYTRYEKEVETTMRFH